MKKYWLFYVIAWFWLQSAMVYAQGLTHPAQQQLQENVDTILAVTHNTGLTESQKVAQITTYADQYLDYERITALAVGLPWRQFTPQQKLDFTAAFKAMVIRVYAHSALMGAAKAKVTVLPKVIEHNPRQIEVFTDIIGRNGKHFEVGYQMYLNKGVYRIYNIRVNGTSLITIYRNQFNQLIKQEGVEATIDVIRDVNNQNELKKVDSLK
ncbi:ABC transporter substrate-binding protein [Neisseriaceae bacterium ESL0693]|nr:ABC transporter substrate-binding protein [Neisseriaceae bacterium ESL0693]